MMLWIFQPKWFRNVKKIEYHQLNRNKCKSKLKWFTIRSLSWWAIQKNVCCDYKYQIVVFLSSNNITNVLNKIQNHNSQCALNVPGLYRSKMPKSIMASHIFILSEERIKIRCFFFLAFIRCLMVYFWIFFIFCPSGVFYHHHHPWTVMMSIFGRKKKRKIKSWLSLKVVVFIFSSLFVCLCGWSNQFFVSLWINRDSIDVNNNDEYNTLHWLLEQFISKQRAKKWKKLENKFPGIN